MCCNQRPLFIRANISNGPVAPGYAVEGCDATAVS
jgi:hypothetical protein